jgi:hypothetical protein
VPTVDYHLQVIHQIADTDLKIANLEKGFGAIVALASSGKIADSEPLRKISSVLASQLESGVESADPNSDRLKVIEAITEVELKLSVRPALLPSTERDLLIWRETRCRLDSLNQRIEFRKTESPSVRRGLSEDGRTYWTPDGPVVLRGSIAAQIISIMVSQWERGDENVSISYIEERIDTANSGGTRLRDRIGRDAYKRLIKNGEGKGTVRLIHPPV